MADLEAPLLPEGNGRDADNRADTNGAHPPALSPALSSTTCPDLPDSELLALVLDQDDPPCSHSGCSLMGGMANLVTTAVGAGMLALPCAVSNTGILLGAALFSLVALLTFASCSIIVKYAALAGAESYGQLVAQKFGRRGSVLLQCAIAVHVSGVMVGYNVIIADVLVGSSPRWSGMLPTFFGRHDDPWWLSRPAVLAALMLGVVAPTLVPRSLRSVAKFSSFSVCMLFVLATSIASLAAVALASGKVAPGVRLLPDPAVLGPSPLEMAANVLSVISVSALAFTCQFNLLPIQKSLREPSLGSMRRVLGLGLALCAALYTTVAISGFVLFGAEVEGDVLKDLTARFVSGLVPRHLALVIVYGVALSYTLCLLANFVLKVWAVREALVEMVVQRPAAELDAGPFYGLTAALVLAAYLVSVLVPSIYGLLALVGATATVVFSYLFPSLVVLASSPTRPQRAAAAALLALGAAMTGTAIYDHLTGHGLE